MADYLCGYCHDDPGFLPEGEPCPICGAPLPCPKCLNDLRNDEGA